MTTPQKIIDIARAAGLHRQQHNLMSNPVQYRYSYDGYEENLERFYNLAVESARDKAIDAACRVAERWIAKERSEIIGLLDGIDKTQSESEDGWWETSTGAEFGAKILSAIKARSKS